MLHGGEAVLERVARRFGLALLGDGAFGAGAVAAGGFDLGGGADCGHDDIPIGADRGREQHLSDQYPITIVLIPNWLER